MVALARDLLGKRIVSHIDGIKTAARIVETEAYRAPDDRGSHAWQNKRTIRTETMFGQGGTAYVYLCYGIHHLFNVVTGPVDTAHAVLIRAVEPYSGLTIMQQRRNTDGVNLTNGPGKWSQAMGITTCINGITLYANNSLVKIYMGEKISDTNILSGPRVGIAYAKECALRPWRFQIKDNRYTSKPTVVKY